MKSREMKARSRYQVPPHCTVRRYRRYSYIRIAFSPCPSSLCSPCIPVHNNFIPNSELNTCSLANSSPMLKSLNDFRRRGLQQFKEAVFAVEQTTDPDFEWQMNRSNELEAQIRKILAAQQSYVSLVEQSCLAASNVTKEINHFYTMCAERMPQAAAKKGGRSWSDFKSGPRFAEYDAKKLAKEHAAANELIRSQEILGAAAWQPAKAVYREEFAQPLATYLNLLPEIKKNAEERKTR